MPPGYMPPGGTDTTGTGGTTDQTTNPDAATAPTPEEMKMWDFMVENGYEKKDFDLLWKNSTPEKRRKDFNDLKKIIDDANEKANKELKEKEKKKEEGGETAVFEPEPVQSLIHVHLPRDARLYFDGVATLTTGNSRTYTTPPVAPTGSYYYSIRVETIRNGRLISQTRFVTVTPGRATSVVFSDVDQRSPEVAQSSN